MHKIKTINYTHLQKADRVLKLNLAIVAINKNANFHLLFRYLFCHSNSVRLLYYK